MNRYISCLRLNVILLFKLITCRFLNKFDYADGYDNVAEHYDDNWLCYIKFCTEKLLKELPAVDSNKPIIDIGCGTGFSTQYLAQHYNNHITGIDISPQMLNKAKENYPHISFVNSDMLEYLKQLPDNSTAMVYSSWAIGYSNPAKIAKEVHRVLESGGIFAFVVNTIDTLPKVFDAFRKTMYNHPEKIKKLLWPRFPAGFSFISNKQFEEVYTCKDSIKIPINEKDICNWLFKTGIMAGFEKVLDLDLFKEELKKSTSELSHHHIIGIYRKK